ncbi:MAG: hypothetical protein K2M37_01345 [Muribaculaceae bacterium]|nr:hypothetical protein [Muribaculaceae bacterium]
MNTSYTPVLTRRFFVSAGDTDAEGRLALPRLTSAIIDIATAHANSLGIGNPAMQQRDCGWVLSRLAIEMTDYPRVNSEYTLSTWIETWNRHFSERCFRIDDSAGSSLGYARSIWMVLSTETRESVGLDRLTLPEGMIAPCECPIPRQGKHNPVVREVPEGGLPRGAVLASADVVTHKFGYADLDFYRHVNTVRYIDLLLNQYSLEEFDNSAVERIELSFMKEIRFGETIELLRSDEGMTSYFSFISPGADQPMLLSKIRRRPI